MTTPESPPDSQGADTTPVALTDRSVYAEWTTDPEGTVFDLTHSGWRGAVKEVTPAEQQGASALSCRT